MPVTVVHITVQVDVATISITITGNTISSMTPLSLSSVVLSSSSSSYSSSSSPPPLLASLIVLFISGRSNIGGGLLGTQIGGVRNSSSTPTFESNFGGKGIFKTGLPERDITNNLQQ